MQDIGQRTGYAKGFLMTLVLALACGPVHAATGLQEEVATVAKELSKAIKGMQHDSVSIGQFSGPPQAEASGGPGIAQMLTDELAKHEITVKRRAELGLKGEFRSAKNDRGRVVARIEGQLTNRSGEVLISFARDVTGAGDVSALLGLTVDLPADKPEKTRDQKLAESIDQPQADVRLARVSASTTSPYAMEIFVKSGAGWETRKATLDEGLAFVQLNRGDVYGVKLINDSPIDAAVTLSIDGVNAFAFSENKEYQHFIVRANTNGFVQGWHRTNQFADAFEVGEFSKSAAAAVLPSGGAIGTITATFAAAWGANALPPEDEFASKFASRGADATVRGERTAVNLDELHRDTGVMRAAISVRYTKPNDLPPSETAGGTR